MCRSNGAAGDQLIDAGKAAHQPEQRPVDLQHDAPALCRRQRDIAAEL
jgi:hypothetical protein